jgi:hypothetical protein
MRCRVEDEADWIETFVRLQGMTPSEVRKHERVLRSLGYAKVCDRLREIAGRRKGSLVQPGLISARKSIQSDGSPGFEHFPLAHTV